MFEVMNIFYSPWMVDKKNKSYNVQLNYNLTKRTQHNILTKTSCHKLNVQKARQKN